MSLQSSREQEVSDAVKTKSIDLHGLTAEGARRLLFQTLKSCPSDVTELEVIHGCNSGQVLLNVVRSISHPRIKRKILGLNNGITVFELKKT